MKIILGINGGTRPGNQDAAAVLIKDGKIAACAEEERFIRIKHAPGVLPYNAIKFCLYQAKITIKDVDRVVFAGATYDSMVQILTNFFNFKFNFCPEIVLIDHHLAHAASAFYTSGLDNSYIITADFSGDNKSTCLFYADKNGIKEICHYSKPDSLGLFYATITQYLGFRYDCDECKTMALAGFNAGIDKTTEKLLKVGEESYTLDTSLLDDRIMPGKSNPSRQEPLFNKKFIKSIGRLSRQEDGKTDRFYLSVANTAQIQLEKAYFALINKLKNSKYESDNLCLAGGVAMNAELNAKIAYSGKFKNLFIQPVSSDAGLSLGGALYTAYKEKSLLPKRIDNLYLGSQFANNDIKKELLRLKIKKFKYISNNGKLYKSIAEKLSRNFTGAVFHGRMEYGPRALGNRSILANPKNKKIKDILNKEFKQRETFQPFAPSILKEYASEYFDFPSTDTDFEFMIVNAKVQKEKKKDIISAVHVNDTARVQLVSKQTNKYFYNIIEEFKKITGIPVLLNTSLNRRGMPIAQTPNDALNIFYTTPLDFIVLENYLIEK